MPSVFGDFLPMFRIMATFFVVFLLAGCFLTRIVTRGMSLDPFQHLAFSFGFNVPILVFISILTFEFKMNVYSALYCLLGMQLLLLAWLLYRFFLDPARLSLGGIPEKMSRSGSGWVFFFGFAVLFFFSYLYYHIGGFILGQAPNGEEVLHLGTMRKLAENPVIEMNNIFYPKGGYTPYLYAPFHLAMAMVSRLSGFDVIAVFSKFRAFSVLLTLPIVYSLMKTLFKNTVVAWTGFALLALLTFTQWLADLPLYYWGQFAPIAYPTDVAAGLVMPVTCLFLFHGLDLSERNARTLLVWTSLLIACLAVLHVREAYYVLLYAGFLMLGFLIFYSGPDRNKVVSRCFMVLAISFLFGLLLLARHHFAPSGFSESEKIRRIAEWRELKSLFRGFQFWIFSKARLQEFMAETPLFLQHWLLLGVCLLPVLVLGRSYQGAVVLFSLIFFFLISVRSPFLRTLITGLTFSEMFMVPARMVSLWCHLTIALFFFGLAAFAAHFPLSLLAMAPAVYFLKPSLQWFSGQAALRPDWFLGWAIFGALILLANPWRGSSFQLARHFVDLAGKRRKSVMAFSLVLLAVLGFSAKEKNLWQRYQESRGQADVIHEREWYEQNLLNHTFPYELIRFIRWRVPIHSVFVHDFRFNFYLPMLVNQYILSAGSAMQEEIPFINDYLKWKGDSSLVIAASDSNTQKIQKYFKLFDRHMQITKNEKPIFNPGSTQTEIEGFVRAMGVDYLLVDPEHYERLSALLATSPVFHRIYDQDGYELFEVQKG